MAGVSTKAFGATRTLQVLSLMALAALLCAAFLYTVHLEDRLPRRSAAEAMRIRLPIPLQILAATGDRYLAANIDVLRAEVVGVGALDADSLHILAAVQRDAATLNPRQEDNYYLAAAILPFGGETNSAIIVLEAAQAARPFDYLPPFLLGTMSVYFNHDFKTAGNWMMVAASRSTGRARDLLHAIAARWYEREEDPDEAVHLLKAMAAQSRDPSFRRFIESRIGRVRGLIVLRKAADAYSQAHGAAPRTLADLVGYGGMTQLPVDPAGIGFRLDAQGLPMLAQKKGPAAK